MVAVTPPAGIWCVAAARIMEIGAAASVMGTLAVGVVPLAPTQGAPDMRFQVPL
jgi:hypothetical protein